jgi:DNA-binding transcriptional LysR family regulator
MRSELTLDQVDALCAVYDAGSFPAAAKLPGRERTSLHHFVDRLENVVGDKLLTRSDPIRLTSMGSVVLPRARQMLEAFQALLDETQHVSPVRLTAYPSHIRQVAKTIAELSSANPQLEIKYYNISDGLRQSGGAELITRLMQHEFDLTIAPSDLLTEDIVEDPLYKWCIRAVFPESGEFEPLRCRDIVRMRDFCGMKALVAPKGHRSRQLFDEENEKTNAHLEIAFASAETEVLVDVARVSLDFVALVPEDAFGFPRVDIGPKLSSEINDLPLGGAYSLYHRSPKSSEALTLKEQSIDLVVRAILLLFASNTESGSGSRS